MAKNKTSHSNKSETKKNTPIEEGRMLPINYQDGGLGLFSNHMIAQNSGTEVHLSFFQLHPPILTGIPEEISRAVAKIDSIEAKPVVHLIIPIDHVSQIIDVLQKQLLPQPPSQQ